MAALHARSPGSSSAENGAKDDVNPTVPTVTVVPAQSIYDPRGAGARKSGPRVKNWGTVIFAGYSTDTRELRKTS